MPQTKTFDIERIRAIPDYMPIDLAMFEGLKRYVESGVVPGQFLTAVLCNDLSEAVGRADDNNQRHLSAVLKLVYNEVPGVAWGSKAKVEAWVKEWALEREPRIQATYEEAMPKAYYLIPQSLEKAFYAQIEGINRLGGEAMDDADHRFYEQWKKWRVDSFKVDTNVTREYEGFTYQFPKTLEGEFNNDVLAQEMDGYTVKEHNLFRHKWAQYKIEVPTA